MRMDILDKNINWTAIVFQNPKSSRVATGLYNLHRRKANTIPKDLSSIKGYMSFHNDKNARVIFSNHVSQLSFCSFIVCSPDIPGKYSEILEFNHHKPAQRGE